MKLKPPFKEFYESIIYGQKLNNYIGEQVKPKALSDVDELLVLAKIDHTFDTIKNHLYDLKIKNIETVAVYDKIRKTIVTFLPKEWIIEEIDSA